MKISEQLANEVFDFSRIDKVHLFAVMPNLHLEKPVETKWVALLPGNDHRMQEMAKASPAVNGLLNCFTDEFGKSRSPVALVFHLDAPKSVRNLEAFVSFRNLFAISCVLRGADYSIGNPNVFWTLYSDFFDFYPFKPSSDGAHLHHRGMALNSYNKAARFKGQVQAYLPSSNGHVKAEPDPVIFPLLLKAWLQRYEKNRPGRKTRKLFRSLAVAYHGASVPQKNLMMGYDFGVNIGMWVSSLEVLAHPGKGMWVTQKDVIQMISSVQFRDVQIRRKRRVKLKRGDILTTNGTGYLYSRLYRARNNFMHGNSVSSTSILHKTSDGYSLLTRVAPVLFKTALISYLGYEGEKVRVKGFTEPLVFRWELRPLERALSLLLTGEKKRTDD